MAKKKEKKKTEATYESMTLEQAEHEFPEDMEFEEIPSGFPDQWIPENEGDTFTGQLVQVDIVEFKRGRKTETSRIARFRKTDGEVISVWESAGLRNIFDYVNVIMGHFFIVTYRGTIDVGKGKNPMKDFKLMIDKKGREKLVDAMK